MAQLLWGVDVGAMSSPEDTGLALACECEAVMEVWGLQTGLIFCSTGMEPLK